MTRDDTTLDLPSDTTVRMTRTFAAPAALVYQVLTMPEHVRRWWAPASRGEMTECTVDLRVGGRWRSVMRTKNGMEAGFSGEFLELEPPRRIVATEMFDPFPDVVSTVVHEFEEAGGVTRYTCTTTYPSKQVRDMVLSTGMEHGARESWRQLGEVVAAAAARIG